MKYIKLYESYKDSQLVNIVKKTIKIVEKDIYDKIINMIGVKSIEIFKNISMENVSSGDIKSFEEFEEKFKFYINFYKIKELKDITLNIKIIIKSNLLSSEWKEDDITYLNQIMKLFYNKNCKYEYDGLGLHNDNKYINGEKLPTKYMESVLYLKYNLDNIQKKLNKSFLSINN